MYGSAYTNKSILEHYDTEPTTGSKNLVDSGAIKQYVDSSDALINAKVDNMISRVGNPFVFKGTVSALNNLPSSGNIVNDTYFVEDEGFMYTWNGTNWDKTSTDVNDQLAHDIATEYNPQKADYKSGNIVMYNNQVYVRKYDATAAEGTFVTDNWIATSIGDELVDEITDLKRTSKIIKETNSKITNIVRQSNYYFKREGIEGLTVELLGKTIRIDGTNTEPVVLELDRAVNTVPYRKGMNSGFWLDNAETNKPLEAGWYVVKLHMLSGSVTRFGVTYTSEEDFGSTKIVRVWLMEQNATSSDDYWIAERKSNYFITETDITTGMFCLYLYDDTTFDNVELECYIEKVENDNATLNRLWETSSLLMKGLNIVKYPKPYAISHPIYNNVNGYTVKMYGTKVYIDGIPTDSSKSLVLESDSERRYESPITPLSYISWREGMNTNFFNDNRRFAKKIIYRQVSASISFVIWKCDQKWDYLYK